MALDPNKLKVGEILARTIYCQVLDAHAQIPGYGRMRTIPTARVRDLKDQTEFFIEGADLLGAMVSTDQFQEEVTIALTDVIALMVNAGEKPFTVCFVKKDGSERTLRGVVTRVEGLLGRSTVIDLEVTRGTPLRQVDHRTVTWLVLDGVKYKVRRI